MSDAESVESVTPTSLAITKAKCKVTRTAVTKFLKTVADKFEVVDLANCLDAQVAVNRLQGYQTQLSELDSNIVNSISEESQLEKEIERSMEYQESLQSCLQRLQLQIESLTPTSSNDTPEGEKEEMRFKSRVKTPKLQLTEFSGDPLRWEKFWDDFFCSVDSRSDLSTINKFKILKQSLKGEALSVADGYFLTQRNYAEVKDALKDRFGDTQVAVFAHFEALLELPPASHDVDQLVKIRDKCEAHIRSLTALGLSEDTFGQVVAPILLSKLPRFVKMEVHRRNGCRKWTLSALREHLKEEISVRTKSDRSFASGASTQSIEGKGVKSKFKKEVRSGAALLVHGNHHKAKGQKSSNTKDSKATIRQCVFCEENHSNWECNKFKTAKDRLKRIDRRCFKCLSKNHQKAECKSTKTCFYCQKAGHNSSLCYKQFSESPVEKVEKTNLVCASSLNPLASVLESTSANQNSERSSIAQGSCAGKGTAIMESAVALVKGSKGSTQARIIFDTGSTLPFIRSKLVHEVGAKKLGETTTSLSRFGESEGSCHRYPEVKVQLQLKTGAMINLCLKEVGQVSTPIRLTPFNLGSLGLLFKASDLAEIMVKEPFLAEIDILIGLDHYYDLMEMEKWRCDNGLVVKQTALGKIVTGYMVDANECKQLLADDHQMLVINEKPDKFERVSLERFWELENIGIMDNPDSCDDEVALQHYNRTVRVREGRYEVQWPFKTENPEITENYQLSFQRLKSVLRKLQGDPELLEKYQQIFHDQQQLGIIEVAPEIPEGIVSYMPHHTVVTPTKETTKVRVVFDASAKDDPLSLSLNESMYRGPVFLNDLCGLILRSRMASVAITSDVEKAFLQISLQKEHRDCTRFLWLKDVNATPTNDNLVIFRYARVAFGVKASPCLLAATIIHHMNATGSETASDIKANTYVDNVLAGRESTSEAFQYYKTAKGLFSSISMNLREWYSNDQSFISTLPLADRGKSTEPSVLGLKWDTTSDKYRCTAAKAAEVEIVASKRQILKTVASVFDPVVGFLVLLSNGSF